ncbi:MAG: 30S ribosomal protein S9 [Deltaproteobacteria bacterium]|nr:30S ribosomal protein S9 [Deltaproteobacteria bacterium]MBW2052417.1 30S ribosomal protein S9 [Deltaproteobacteria bacterium]MBW2140140.1 30S ribosomal protein S9 [Deltaproteobacteria bacterium]MBW2323773.1 30S ribosomal protein S9 [Deltaproteobacteria bacterium]
MTAQNRYYATGKRKTSIARVWMTPGEGKIEINKRDIADYFPRETLKAIVNQPLALTGTEGQFNCYILANGGGISGQAGAVKHGIAKALLAYNPSFRPVLKKAGFLTRDARKKERKKYGQKGARARYQYSKR